MIIQGQARWAATGVLLVAIFFAHADLAQAQLRIVTYNTATAAPRNNTLTARSGADTVLAAIGAETMGGIAQPIDVLLLQEQFSMETSTQSFVDLLNDIYDPIDRTMYARSIVNGFASADFIPPPDTGAGGRPGLVYNTRSVSLIDEVAFGIANGSNQARQTLRYQLRPLGYDSSADFYVYNDHYKAGSTSNDKDRRLIEAQSVRNNADALGQGAHIIYAGDYNIRSSTETMYTELLAAGNGEAFDPIDMPGTWHESSSMRITHTQSPATSSQFSGQALSGVDDRFDFQLFSDEFQDGEGLSYLPGSYHAFGNNATHNCCNSPITSGTGAAPNVLTALTTASDHLPVVADYQLPAMMDAQLAPIPPTVSQGALVNINVMIENIANVLTSNGADELDYTLSVSGDLFGNATGTDFALGNANTHQVTLDTSAMGPRNGTITVTSSSQAVANGFFSFPVNFTVGEGGGPTFGIIAKDTFDTTLNRIRFSQSPAPGVYNSADDGFETYQVGVSASIPFQLIDESIDENDTLGIVDSSTKSDIWFGVTDTVNNDSIPAANPGTATATWEFDIFGVSGLQVSIDMGAMGDFEDGTDTFDWTYSIDGGTVQPLFTSSVDEADSANYTMAGGSVVILNDPLLMTDTGNTTTKLSNIFQTLTSELIESGSILTLELMASTNGGSEAYAFDNIIIWGFTGGSSLEADFNEDRDVDGADLAQWQGDFGLNENSDADGDSDSDGADFLVWQQQFGPGSNIAPLSRAVPEPTSAFLLGIAIVGIFLRLYRTS
jgi:hypothetical protein